MTKLTIPNPPPLNHLFFNRRNGGRAKSKRYMTWLNAAGWILKGQRPEPVSGCVRIDMEIGETETTIRVSPSVVVRPKGMRADMDGLLKAPLDLLSAHNIIDDDRCVGELHVRWK